ALATEIIPALAILAPVGFAVARYYSTRYALTDEALLHNYGVARKNRQVLPRRNIQNLSTSAGLIARATGLVELTVSDASQGGDINLRLLSAEDAEELMTLLRRQAQGPAVDPGVDPLADPSRVEMAAPSGANAFVADPIHSLDLVDLVKLRAVTSAGPLLGLFALVILGAVVLSFPDITSDVAAEMSWGGVIFILAPMAAGFLAAVAPVLALGGFRLWSDPDRLRIKTGLLTEVQVNARRERLQLVEVNRHILARRLGLEAIRFETADVEGGSAGVNYLAPAVDKDSWPRYAADALGGVELGEDDLARVSPLTKRRSLVRFAVAAIPVIIALAVLVVIASGGNRTILQAGFVVLIVGYVSFALWYSRRRAERLGWAVGPEQFLFRTGVIGERLILVRKDKLQILRLDQSYFQRRLGLASVRVGTAGMGLRSVVSLPDLELGTAAHIVQHLAVASSNTPLAQTL
ncbi:MAG: PH domain-containing protein, partial [Acidimicrobiia bacterium]